MTLNVEQLSSNTATRWINDGCSEAQSKPRPKRASMRHRTRRHWSAPVAVAALLFASCGGSSEDATTATTPTTTTANGDVAGTSALQIEEGPLVYVPMGNSLTFNPSSNHFIARYTAMLEEDFGVDVELRSHTVGGQRTDDFLEQLRTNDSLRNDLGDADVVTLLIPNDEWSEPFQTAVGAGGRDPSECGGDDNQQCLRDVISSYQQHVDQIFDELTAIVDPAVTLIRVQDFYQFGTNQMTPEAFDITYPHWREGQEYVEQVAGQYGLPVAQVFDDFMGTDGLHVDLVADGLVDPDGIHPTADGAERMAMLMHDLGYNLAS
jgi:lysophospholipase L1-like esterase